MPIRCFIAIEVPEDIQEALGRVQDKLSTAGADVKWADTKGIHLTTRFLGDIEMDDVPKVTEVMNACAREAAPMEFEVSGLGTFPPQGTPRVIWAGIKGDVDRLVKLVDCIEQRLSEAVRVAPETRAYHAHVTLGRMRTPRNARPLQDAMQKCAVELGTFTADGLTLFMSELTREGAVYTPMAKSPFGG